MKCATINYRVQEGAAVATVCYRNNRERGTQAATTGPGLISGAHCPQSGGTIQEA